jgi:hypothetical protein
VQAAYNMQQVATVLVTMWLISLARVIVASD